MSSGSRTTLTRCVISCCRRRRISSSIGTSSRGTSWCERDNRGLSTYQGGRRGALPYDLASLLLDAKADLPFEFRDRLKEQYLDAAAALTSIDRNRFEEFYRGFSLIRILQAMGRTATGVSMKRKAHFLQSVPYAIRNLERLLAGGALPVRLPALG